MLTSPTTLIAQVTPERIETVCGEDPRWACRKVLEWTESRDLAEIAGWVLDVPFRVLLIGLIAWVVAKALRRIVKVSLRRAAVGSLRRRIEVAKGKAPQALFETREQAAERTSQRVAALSAAMASAVAFLVWFIAGLLMVAEIGVSLGPLLAGAGVAGVALGFGAQSLVKDLLAGTFILIEDQFAVGDIVDLGEASGVVEGISLRATRLRSIDGIVWHVPNGEITRVGNMSQHWSRSLIDVEVAYDSDLELAKSAIKSAADEVFKEDAGVLEEPEMWGVEALGASGITLRLVVKTKPSEQWRVGRELRQRIKMALDREGIEIPFPQQTVWHRSEEGPAPAGGGAGGASSSEA